MTTAPIRVAIADDHPIVRDGLRLLFESRPEVELVGEASDGDDIVAIAMRTRPHVVIMDVHMPGTNGIDATRRIVAGRSDIGVLVLTMYDDDETVFAALRAGARGYLTKDARSSELAQAIETVHRGDAHFDPGVQRRLVDSVTTKPVPNGLTPREVDVLRLIADGRSNPEIAKHLHISQATVKSHINNLFAKAGLRDRAQAVTYAFRHHLAQ